MISAVIVGCGRIAGGGDIARPDAYAPALLRSPEYRLVSCVDRSEGVASAFADRYGCEVAEDLASALDLFRPQLVIIATPDDQHAPVLMSLLEDEHCPPVVVVEKPYCLTESEAKEIASAQSGSRVNIFVNHNRRLDSRFHKLRSAIREEEFGQPLKLRATYYGGWLHNGIHVVDTLSFLFDCTPTWLSATKTITDDKAKDPLLSLVGYLPNSDTVVEIEEVDARYYQLFEFELRFTGARVLIEDFGSSIRVQYVEINAQNERVLRSQVLEDTMDVELGADFLLQLVGQYLGGELSATLAEVSLPAASASMVALWKGLEIANVSQS